MVSDRAVEACRPPSGVVQRALEDEPRLTYALVFGSRARRAARGVLPEGCHALRPAGPFATSAFSLIPSRSDLPGLCDRTGFVPQ